jgi:alpha-methylacyl-CoA racemase
MISLLEDVRVLDFSRLIPGPYVTMLLADLGADVVKVEDTNAVDYYRGAADAAKHGGVNSAFQWLNRNKRGICLDLSRPEGMEVLRSMVAQVDVFVEGARPGAADRRGYGYDAIRALNPRIVYCSITGFGQTGPFARMATHGGAYDAVAGLAAPYELPDGTFVHYRPYPHGLTFGCWLAAMAVNAALVKVKSKGEGCYLDISCADATLMALAQEAIPVLNNHEGWPPRPDEHVTLKYCYYRTRDDRFMLLQAVEKHFWEGFCEAVGRPDLRERGNWSNQVMDFTKATEDQQLRQELVELFASRTQEEWVELFLKHNIAGGPYYALSEATGTALFREREMFLKQSNSDPAREILTVANAVKVAGERFEIHHAAPEMGQHNSEVLRSFGYDQEALDSLTELGILVAES